MKKKITYEVAKHTYVLSPNVIKTQYIIYKIIYIPIHNINHNAFSNRTVTRYPR